MSEANPHARAEHALRQVERAAKRGDLTAAERWSKTAERLCHAAATLAAAPAPHDPEADAEAKRAELRARIQRFVAFDLDVQRWEAERDAYEAQHEAALANGVAPPAPLRPHPAGPLGEEAHGMAILTGKEV